MTEIRVRRGVAGSMFRWYWQVCLPPLFAPVIVGSLVGSWWLSAPTALDLPHR